MSQEQIYALRGATTVEKDEVEKIEERVSELFETMLKENELEESELSFCLLSQTSDLKSRNAAGALRKKGHCHSVPLFCVQEAEIDNMLPFAVRILLQVNHPKRKEPKMVYLHNAKTLRPDLNK
ncbi:MAG: chorismate mutase [Sphaerochaetaceae bacterium]|nr:chorismate mutase [Sphaerochaetaceae bacterium]